MPSWQFQTHINPNLTVSIPPEVASQLLPDSEVQIVLTTPSGDDAAWERLTMEQFLEGYAPGDAIYDQLQEG
jgi:hypothetical protein